MRFHIGGVLPVLGALAYCNSAAAEWRCDCTNIVGSCSATAAVHDSFVEVTSDVAQCARVDYLVDGIPFVALVVDGSDRQDWITRSESPSVIIQGCQVCRDNATTDSPPEFGAGLTSEGEPTRLIGVDPVYPAAAANAGLEGYVEVGFTVTAAGTVTDAHVVAAEPADVFDAAALAAVSRWRYTLPPDSDEWQLTERIEFDPDDAILSLARPASPRDPVLSDQIARNACVHEESRYDFGAAVDVSLVNACDEPLLVYTCSAGTGAYRDRWICQDPESTSTLLSPSTAAARGTRVTSNLEGVARVELTRAPNSEYWWLACAVDDTECRADGREWVRSMNRQLAAVDPQDRTSTRVARSY